MRYSIRLGGKDSPLVAHGVRFEDFHMVLTGMLGDFLGVGDGDDQARLLDWMAAKLVGEAVGSYISMESHPYESVPMSAGDGLLEIWAEQD